MTLYGTRCSVVILDGSSFVIILGTKENDRQDRNIGGGFYVDRRDGVTYRVGRWVDEVWFFSRN